MEVINCSFIHIYKQSNRVIPTFLGREIGTMQVHTCNDRIIHVVRVVNIRCKRLLRMVFENCHRLSEFVKHMVRLFFIFCFHVFFSTSTQQKENSLNLFLILLLTPQWHENYYFTHLSIQYRFQKKLFLDRSQKYIPTYLYGEAAGWLSVLMVTSVI